jgi:serine/threonine protein phosphatase 1
MSGRTFAVGDVHGERAALERLLLRLPPLDAGDTLLFIGDYVDRGPESRQVVDLVRLELSRRTAAKLVTLCGNHEEAWLKTVAGGGPGFVMPPGNGCLATFRSYAGGAVAGDGGLPSSLEEMKALFSGSFFPPEVLAWMRALPYYHEDEHAIYLHGGLPPVGGGFAHPREYPDPSVLVWCRSKEFFTAYRGKRVVFGHTPVRHLPQGHSEHTPGDAADAYVKGDVVGIDTGCGRGGFLTAVELPGLVFHESRG